MQLGRLVAPAPVNGISNGDGFRLLTIFFFAEEMKFNGSGAAAATGLRPIYIIEFMCYNNSRPVGAVFFAFWRSFC
jgi:hypothetical protein